MLPIHTFDILCINETWLNRNHLNQSIELMFFADPLRHDRIDVSKSCGGGCAIYYKFGIECVQLPVLENIFISAIDSTWARIKTPGKTLVIGTIYKPPDVNNVIFLQNMEDLLLHPLVSDNDVIITGDFNIDWRKNSPTKLKLCDITTAFDLQQNINGSTHIGLTNESCIDLVFTRTNLKIINHGIIFNSMHRGITWHNFTYIYIDITPSKSPRQLILKRNTRNFDAERYVHEAFSTQFVTSSKPNSIDLNVLTYVLEQSISNLVNKHIPFKQIRVRSTRKPWLTHNLLKSISAKNRLFNHVRKTKDTNTWKVYKIIRNVILQQINQAKKAYYTNIINKQAHSTNKDPQFGVSLNSFHTKTMRHKN